MARITREVGRAMWFVLPLLTVVVLIGWPPQPVGAAYSTPYWSYAPGAVQSCACDDCVCDRPSVRTPEGVSKLDGGLEVKFHVATYPGRVDCNDVTITWNSMIDGHSQWGNGTLWTYGHSIERVNSTTAVWRRPDGQQVTYAKSGGSWSTTDCGVVHTLNEDSQSGLFSLVDKWGGSITFDAHNMPDAFIDSNANVDDFTYDSNRKLTGMTDDRGHSLTVTTNSSGYITAIAGSPQWSFGYDSSGNLTSITSPATPDQTLGITTTIAYDGSNRISSITDGRGNTVRYFTWVGSTRQIDKITVDGDDEDYTYYSDRTEVTDRNGGVHRYYFLGTNLTKEDMLVAGQSKYATEYRYSGNLLVTIVKPRGNRIDLTYNSGNLSERRFKTTDTANTSTSDIVHSWGYTSNFVTSYTDSLGNQTAYGRDSAGNLTSVTYPTVMSPATQAASKTLTYNSRGQVTEVTDEEGMKTKYTYFSSGVDVDLLEKVEVDSGVGGLDLTTTYGYDPNWNVNSVTDPRGKTTTTTWDDLRRRTEVQAPSPLSYRTRFHYDGNGNLTSKDVENIDKNGTQDSSNPWFTTTYTHTPLDQVATIVEEITPSTTRSTSFDYDNCGNRIRVTKPEGNKDRWTFNEANWIIAHTRGETDAAASTEEFQYDQNGNRTVHEDGRDYQTTYQYDLFDRLRRTTNAQSHYEQLDYDENGNVTSIQRKDSANNVLQRRTQYFDERNRMWRTSYLRKDPGTTYSDASTTVERLKTGEIKKSTNARGKDTNWDFDTAHRITQVTDAVGNELSVTYDLAGNRTHWSIEEVNGGASVTHEYEATYDEVNRRLTRVEIDRTNSSNVYTTTYDYDSRGNLVWMVNAEGNPTRWTFDGLGRMTKREAALTFGGGGIEDFATAQVTQWGFDMNNRLVSQSDDGTNTSTWDYDALDRATTLTYPDSSTVEYTYDKNGNVTQMIDSAGNDVDDVYDSLNRNTSRTITRATGFVDTTSETRTFDALNRMTSTSDDDYIVEYSYGVLGLDSMVYEESQSYYDPTTNPVTKTNTKTVRTVWDAVGNKSTELYPSSLLLTYAYNDVDRLSSVSDGTNTIASYAYVGLRAKQTTFQNGATETWTYGGFREDVTTVHHETSAPATILRLDYGYDKVHDRTYERFGTSGSAGDGFVYDKARRLTTAWMGSATPSAPSSAAYVQKIDYNMDDDGNRTSVVVTPYQQSPTTTNYSTNTLNEYTAVGGASWTWDGNGNCRNNGTYKFVYNYKNLICEVRDQSDGLLATYEYDASGRRIEKNVTGGVTERYVYSGVETIATYDSSNTWKQDFVFGKGIDGIVCLIQADILDYDADQNTTETTRSFYHRNALGSVMEITDMNQAAVVSYRYDPYGTITISRNSQTQSTDPLGQHWTFTGRFYDEEVAQYYYRARYYAPASGSFGERDPLSYLAGPNLFQYVSSRPTVLRDPFGLDSGVDEDNVVKQIEPSALTDAIKKLLEEAGIDIPTTPGGAIPTTWADVYYDFDCDGFKVTKVKLTGITSGSALIKGTLTCEAGKVDAKAKDRCVGTDLMRKWVYEVQLICYVDLEIDVAKMGGGGSKKVKGPLVKGETAEKKCGTCVIVYQYQSQSQGLGGCGPQRSRCYPRCPRRCRPCWWPFRF